MNLTRPRGVPFVFFCAMTLSAQIASAQVSRFESLDAWTAAVGSVDHELLFEGIELNELITTQYADIGVVFSGDQGGPYGNGGGLFNNQAGTNVPADEPGTIQIDLETPLRAASLDVWGSVSGATTLSLFSGETKLFESVVPRGGKGPDGRIYAFYGFAFGAGVTVDRILIDPQGLEPSGAGMDSLRLVTVPEPSFLAWSLGLFFAIARRRANGIRP